MTVRALRAKQRGSYCSYCEKRAMWRGCGFTKFACDDHYDLLYLDDVKSDKPDYSDAAWSLKL